MATKKITLDDVLKKHLRLIGYLFLSGLLGWILANYVAKDPALTAIFAPAINYVLYSIEKELRGEGVIKATRLFK